jgi:phosphoserine aminotransferase
VSDPNPTVGELFKAKAVTDEQLNAAVEAYCDNPTTSGYAINEHYAVNLLDAVTMHDFTQRVLANADASRALKRAAIRSAILLARAHKA